MAATRRITAAMPQRLYLAGHSAGGHLAAMALATEWRTFGLPEDVIKGVCAISGVFDLEPIRLCYLNEVGRPGCGRGAPQQPDPSGTARALPGDGRGRRAGDPGVP